MQAIILGGFSVLLSTQEMSTLAKRCLEGFNYQSYEYFDILNIEENEKFVV